MIPGRSVRPGKGDGLAHRLPIPNMIDEQENEAGVDPMAFGFAQAFVQIDQPLVDIIRAGDVRGCDQGHDGIAPLARSSAAVTACGVGLRQRAATY